MKNICIKVLPCFLIISCGPYIKISNLDSRYQTGTIPTHFSKNMGWKSKIFMSAGVDNQETIKISKDYLIKQDSNGRIRDFTSDTSYHDFRMESKYSIKKSNYNASVSFLTDLNGVFGGLALGTAYPDTKLYQFGIYLGLSGKIYKFVNTVSIGRFSSNTLMDAKFISHYPSHTDLEGTWGRDSLNKYENKSNYQIMVASKYSHFKNISPYMSYSVNWLDLWPGSFVVKSGSSNGGNIVLERSSIRANNCGIGIIYSFIRNYDMNIEMQFSNINYSDLYNTYHFNYKFEISKEI